jgi:hypothetical protein
MTGSRSADPEKEENNFGAAKACIPNNNKRAKQYQLATRGASDYGVNDGAEGRPDNLQEFRLARGMIA